MVRIMFVCTGNMFRSVCAEVALKKYLSDNKEKLYGMCGFSYSEIKYESCGTSVRPQQFHQAMTDELRKKDVNIINHMYMQINDKLVEESDLIIVMGEDHKKFVKDNFRRKTHLFNEVCHGTCEGIPDDWEVLGEGKRDPNKEREYICKVVSHIFDSMPNFAANFRNYLG